MKTVDEKDEKVLEALREHARWSTQKIAKKTGIPITTVHNRIKKLEDSGILKGYTTVLDEKLLGNVVAYVLINVSYHLPDKSVLDQEFLAKKIMDNTRVEEANIIAGSSDLLVKVRAKNIDELNTFVVKYLRSVPGIESTQTLVVLKSV
jgi:DNA-binding Lrp family transcriptional regulator